MREGQGDDRDVMGSSANAQQMTTEEFIERAFTTAPLIEDSQRKYGLVNAAVNKLMAMLQIYSPSLYAVRLRELNQIKEDSAFTLEEAAIDGFGEGYYWTQGSGVNSIPATYRTLKKSYALAKEKYYDDVVEQMVSFGIQKLEVDLYHLAGLFDPKKPKVTSPFSEFIKGSGNETHPERSVLNNDTDYMPDSDDEGQ